MCATPPTVGFTGLHQQGYDSLTLTAFFKTFVTHPSQRTDTLLFLPTHTFTLAPESTHSTIQEPLHFFMLPFCVLSLACFAPQVHWMQLQSGSATAASRLCCGFSVNWKCFRGRAHFQGYSELVYWHIVFLKTLICSSFILIFNFESVFPE